MTILRDLYQTRRSIRPRAWRSRGKMQQGQVADRTLLGRERKRREDDRECTVPHRPTSKEARIAMEGRLGETAFVADWSRVVFLHFEVDADLLQPEVPFALDQFKGKSFVSFVAFTMHGMRLPFGGRLTRWLTAPIATHRFLNLRTYVRHGERTGIFFMKEWLNNRFAVALGPKTFGLPYHYANLNYHHADKIPAGRALSEKGGLHYSGHRAHPPAQAKPGTRDEFLLERYTAYTAAGRRPKFFRVWHRPWKCTPLRDLAWKDTTLLDGLNAPWVKTARFVGAHFSPGVADVWMGRPHLA